MSQFWDLTLQKNKQMDGWMDRWTGIQRFHRTILLAHLSKNYNDHVNTIIWEFNPDHIILHIRTNELNSSETASQITRTVIKFAVPLNSYKNTATLSLNVLWNDNLNRKVHEVKNQLINICGERISLLLTTLM